MTVIPYIQDELDFDLCDIFEPGENQSPLCLSSVPFWNSADVGGGQMKDFSSGFDLTLNQIEEITDTFGWKDLRNTDFGQASPVFSGPERDRHYNYLDNTCLVDPNQNVLSTIKIPNADNFMIDLEEISNEGDLEMLLRLADGGYCDRIPKDDEISVESGSTEESLDCLVEPLVTQAQPGVSGLQSAKEIKIAHDVASEHSYATPPRFTHAPDQAPKHGASSSRHAAEEEEVDVENECIKRPMTFGAAVLQNSRRIQYAPKPSQRSAKDNRPRPRGRPSKAARVNEGAGPSKVSKPSTSRAKKASAPRKPRKKAQMPLEKREEHNRNERERRKQLREAFERLNCRLMQMMDVGKKKLPKIQSLRLTNGCLLKERQRRKFLRRNRRERRHVIREVTSTSGRHNPYY